VSKTNETESYVETLKMAEEIDQHVAHATIRLGEIKISGLKIWSTRKGRLYVHWPSYWAVWRWIEVVEVSPEQRSDIEADVIACFRDKKKQLKKENKVK